jgi:replication-associated recombination protein RarA
MNLADRYRPNRWSEVIGQARAVAVLDRLRERGGLAGRGYWISGRSGTGKTTIARLLAREVAPPFATVELDAQALTPAALRRIEDECAGKPLGGRGWCYVVNEAHGLSCDSVRKLLTMFDELPAFVTWIFTTTTQGQARFDGMADDGPLLSRLTALELQADPIALAARAQELARLEGLDGQPPQAYQALLLRLKCNLRAALQAIESGAMLVADKPVEPEPPEPDEPPDSPVGPSKPNLPKAPTCSAPADPVAGWRQITARLGGRCIRCGETVKPGETIGHNQQVGVLCPACWRRKTDGQTT